MTHFDVPHCRVCGCTDDDGCPDGCWWVDDPRGGNLCSQCVGSPMYTVRSIQACRRPKPPTGHRRVKAHLYRKSDLCDGFFLSVDWLVASRLLERLDEEEAA